MSGIAELGFIVVMVDGMGTSFRSRAFENVCYKNLKDARIARSYCLDVSLPKSTHIWT